MNLLKESIYVKAGSFLEKGVDMMGWVLHNLVSLLLTNTTLRSKAGEVKQISGG